MNDSRSALSRWFTASMHVGVVGALSLLLIAAAACGDDEQGDTTAMPDSPEAAEESGGGAFAPVSGPGISVTEALESTLDQPLLVNGYVFADGERVRLCEAMLESFPPQCGGAALNVAALDISTWDGVQAEGSVMWLHEAVQLLGIVDGETLTLVMT